MKLNRNKLRKLLLQESRQVLSEMSMGMGLNMSGGGRAPVPGTPEYDYTAQIIQNCIMSCIQRSRCDQMEVTAMCQEMCADYGCPQFANYCVTRVMTMCQQMGL